MTSNGHSPTTHLSVRAYLRAAFGVLDAASRRRLGAIVAIVSALAFLDLAGLFVVLFLTVTATQAQAGVEDLGQLPLPDIALRAADVAGLETIPQLAGALAVLAVLLFVGKAVFAALGLRRTLRFLAHREADLSGALTRRLLAAPLTFHLRRRYVDLATDITYGAECLVMKAIAPGCLMVAELVLVAVVSIGLVVLAPAVAGVAILYFGGILFVLNRVIGHRTSAAGEADASSNRQSMMLLQWALGGFREVVTRGAQSHFADMVQEVRESGARGRADAAYLNWLPRYFLEASLVTGMALVFVVQLPFATPSEALAGLALFAVAGFRLLPSLNRIQASFALAKSGQSYGERCLDALDELGKADLPRSPAKTEPMQLSEGVCFERVSFRYDGADRDALVDLDLMFEKGRTTALVGGSGSGKTTAIDVMLGLLPPTRGRVLVDRVPIQDVVQAWRRSVGYVPQAAFLMPSTIRDNVTLAAPRADVDDATIWRALEQASMDKVVRGLPGGLDYVLGDAGAGLSGGQRQRLGIARALYLNPAVLILDEATSALDVSTEAEITETLANLDAALTKVVVAHRLSTVRHADHVMFFSEGRVISQGTFFEVSAEVPDFARQIALSGIPGAER